MHDTIISFFEVVSIANENIIETVWVYMNNFNYTSKILCVHIKGASMERQVD